MLKLTPSADRRDNAALGGLYSPIQHLADALFLNHNPRERSFCFMTAYTAYCDASGTRRTSMLIVGGYISTVEDWRQFEVDWKAALDRAKVPYFHMKKFVSCQRPFHNKKWQCEETRREFLGSLVNAIARNVDFGLFNILSLEDWEQVNNEYDMEGSRLTPFAVAGCMAISSAQVWCYEHAIPLRHMAVVFEDGDEDKGDLMHWCKKCWGFTPDFKPKQEKEPSSPNVYPLTPLQACDWTSWEIRRAETDVSKPECNLRDFALRKSLESLLGRIHHSDDHHMWSADNLRALCEKHDVPKR